MAEQDNSDKTEKPTAKRLRDARKKGDVAKSKELTNVVILAGWLFVAGLTLGAVGQRLEALFAAVFVSLRQPGGDAMIQLGMTAATTLVEMVALLVVPVALLGVMVEFLQVGPVMAMDKLVPKFEKLNPATGLKKMFSMDNIIELAKSIATSLLLITISWLVLRSLLGDIMVVPGADIATFAGMEWEIGFRLLAWTIGCFLVIAGVDAVYQRFSFTKKMQMSKRDIRQESKENEGDPLLKGQRRRLQMEWLTTNYTRAAREANVLVTNPTHIAVALSYDAEDSPVPVVTAKAAGALAQRMRAAAEEEGVPIMQNIPLARALNSRVEIEDTVPSDMFEAVAEVIVWAQKARGSGRAEALAGKKESNW